MSQPSKEQELNRRAFLKAAAVTAAAATATGAGAAYLRTSSSAPPPPAASVTAALPGAIPAGNHEAIADLFAQLAAAQAENVSLKARLDATQRRLKSEQGGNSQVEAMSLELESTTQQVSVLSGLLALYEQLEEVDLSQALGQGIAAVSNNIAELIDDLPTLQEGIETGRQALDQLEEQIPALESGRRWLEEHTDTLSVYFQSVEQLLAAVVDAASPLLDMLNQWFQDILKWLPFGLGQRASEIMQAIATLLTETPHTISGLNQHLGQPLDAWLGDDQAEAPLRQNLVRPLREKVLNQSDLAVTRARQIQMVYQAELAEPAELLAQQRQALRLHIADYRQQHDLA